MPEYICIKCGEKGFSKNIATRSFFADDSIASIMTNICNVVTEKQRNGRRKVTLEFKYCDTNSEWDDDELEMQVVTNLRMLSEDNVKHWLCNHKLEVVTETGEPLSGW